MGAGRATGGLVLLRRVTGFEPSTVVLTGLLLFAAWCPVTVLAVRSGRLAASAAVFVLVLPLAPTFTGLYLLVGAARPRAGRTRRSP